MANIVDVSQIMYASIHVESDANQCAKHPSDENKKLIKHFILNSIRANFMLHKKQYGQMTLACDSVSWRNEVFPNYKCQRKAAKKLDTSGISWSFVGETLDELIDDLRTFFPFPTIKVARAEGDDIIGTLVPYITKQSLLTMEEDIFGNIEPETILITSSDQDYFQLHNKFVKQYSPVMKKQIKPTVPIKHAYLEKVLKGESGNTTDSIPNFRMGDNTFIDGIRQKPVSQKTLDKFFASPNPIDECESDEERTNFLRNEQLVSFSKIPADIQESIIVCYNEQVAKKNSKMALMNYLTQHRMNNLLSQISDFYL